MKYSYSRRELYAAGEFLGEMATQRKAGGGMIYGGGGGGGQPTSSTTNTSNIPEYAQPYVESMLGATQQQLFNTHQDESGNTVLDSVKPYQPYSTNPQDYVAGFSPLQNQAMSGVAGLQLPGEYGAAAGLTGAATMGAMGAGRDYQNMATNPYAVGAYMNPYVQQSLQPQLNEIQRQADIQGNQIASQATAAGAFGGTRGALAKNEAQRNALLAQQSALGQGYNQAFNQAQQAMQYGAGLGLQGQQAAMQGAGQLANIGQLGLQGQQGIYNLQNQMGSQQQQQQQNIINNAINNYAMAQQYPQQQLAFMNAQIRGLPLQATTTQSYQAPPNLMSQIGGIGMGAYGLSKMAKGGSVKTKHFDGGGIASLDNKVMNNPLAFSADQVKKAAASGVISKQTEAIALSQIENAPKPPVQNPQSTVLGELEAKAQPAGITQLPSNLPVKTAAQGGIMNFNDGGDALDNDDGYANGGIIAFDRGGNVKRFDEGGTSRFSQWWKDVTAPSERYKEYEARNKAYRDLIAAQKAQPGLFETTTPESIKTAQERIDAAAAAFKSSPTAADKTDDKKEVEKPSIVIHDDKTDKKGNLPPAAPPKGVDYSQEYGGINDLLKEYTGLIRGAYRDPKELREEAKNDFITNLGFSMAAGQSPFFASNVGQAGASAAKTLQEQNAKIDAERRAQVGQLVNLGLKGVELRQELKKLGITEDYYKAHAPLFAAQASYYGARAANPPGQGGSIGSPTALKMWQEYKGQLADPTSSPVFKSLDKTTQKFLLKADPSSGSYKEAYKVFKDKLDTEFGSSVQFMRAVGTKGSNLTETE